MLWFAALASLGSMGISAVLGWRLLRLAARHRKAPEALVGAAFLVAGVLGYGVMLVGNPSQGAVSGPAAARLAVGGLLLISAGVILNYAFVWRVFRAHSRWGTALFALCSLLVIATFGSQLDARIGGAGRTLVYTLGDAARMGVGVWGSLEAARLWLQLRRRMRLGLADPVVANRVLLWGLASFGTFAVMLVPSLWVAPSSREMPPALIVVISLLIASVALTQWLAFLPPAAYLRRISAGQPARS